MNLSLLIASIFRFFRKVDGTWAAERVIRIPPKKVKGWALPELEGKKL